MNVQGSKTSLIGTCARIGRLPTRKRQRTQSLKHTCTTTAGSTPGTGPRKHRRFYDTRRIPGSHDAYPCPKGSLCPKYNAERSFPGEICGQAYPLYRPIAVRPHHDRNPRQTKKPKKLLSNPFPSCILRKRVTKKADFSKIAIAILSYPYKDRTDDCAR
jgi:hypothetical protein